MTAVSAEVIRLLVTEMIEDTYNALDGHHIGGRSEVDFLTARQALNAHCVVGTAHGVIEPGTH